MRFLIIAGMHNPVFVQKRNVLKNGGKLNTAKRVANRKWDFLQIL